MKHLFLLSVVFSSASLADAACESLSRDRYVDGWQDGAAVQRITTRVTPDSRVYCEYYPDRERQLNFLVMREHGRLQGVEYKLHYSDGSAVIQGTDGERLEDANYNDNWHLSCRSAGPAAQVLCALTRDDIVIERSADGRIGLTVGADYLKSSDVLVRVKEQSAVKASAAEGYTPVQIDRIIQQMRAGESLDSRYHKRDRQRPTDRKTSLYGFNQAMFLMENIMEQLATWKAGER